jgi:hypothetical protein
MATIQEVKLISKKTLMKFTQINDSLDENLISAATYVAQDMHLEQYLGTSLINRLKDDVNDWSGIYDVLMSDYIPKVLSWWTLYHLYPMMYIKHDNGGLYKRTAEDVETITDTEMSNLKNEAKSKAESYTQRLIDFLCANSGDIPEYNDNVWPNKFPKTNSFLNTQIFTSSMSATSRTSNPRFDPQLIQRGTHG